MSRINNIPVSLILLRTIFPVYEKVLPKRASKTAHKVFLTPINFDYRDQELHWKDKAHKFKVKVNGVKHSAYFWGQGPEIVFVHGWSGRGLQFFKFIQPLTDLGYKVVVFDVAGHGTSKSTPTGLVSMLDFTAALEQVLQHCSNPVAVVGHSLGAAASFLGIKRGFPITTFISIGAPVIGSHILNSFGEKLNASTKTVNKMVSNLQKSIPFTFEELTVEHTAYAAENIPVLIVHDENDKEVSIENARRLKQLLPLASLHITEKLGHNRILKNDEVVNRIVKFIQKNTSFSF